jgi:hypothetical protein
VLEPRIANIGDRIERETWETIGPYFPHYEVFWRLHIYPLRAKNSIHVRDGIDENLQLLAMLHYSIYVNLARARKKIEDRADELRFFDEIYANLQRSCELAVTLVSVFDRIHRRFVPRAPGVNNAPLGTIQERFRAYRNLIHTSLLAFVMDEGTIRIPKPIHIEKFKLWTNVLYHSDPEEFEDVKVQLENDFRALCSALEQVWKEMCSESEPLCSNSEYVKLQQVGNEPDPPTINVSVLPASGQAFPMKFSPPSPRK